MNFGANVDLGRFLEFSVSITRDADISIFWSISAVGYTARSSVRMALLKYDAEIATDGLVLSCARSEQFPTYRNPPRQPDREREIDAPILSWQSDEHIQ
ncbi:hypothetical protein SEA_JUMBO_9 [Gordonia phage Jumbo]|uniref:Uncharacterized protein n=1 Tax=Gordonia phage Jumbo TaxID=1887650 RepID=A0A1B3B0U2_9CAUD|nr:hypothetical protein BIZ69_gp009 [Gordonia phage Jumbo]AOE44611.1 hypothetical protein SEA_JUMBO_9 [Gordonia phage Jumbo]